PEFARWRKAFLATVSSLQGSSSAGAQKWPPHSPSGGQPASLELPDPALLDRSGELLDLPELGGWFLDPARVAPEALALLQARETRLVVSDQIKRGREAAILDGVIGAHFPAPARLRWAGRLRAMAEIFAMTGREPAAALARTVAAALADASRPATAIPF